MKRNAVKSRNVAVYKKEPRFGGVLFIRYRLFQAFFFLPFWFCGTAGMAAWKSVTPF